MILVSLYLAAIVAANVTVATFGPAATIPVAFLWIGLDLTTRDQLHERWRGRGLWARMVALIVVGGLLSWLVNRDAGTIALASTVAFLGSSLADAAAYQLLGRSSRRVRVNGSNLVGATVDSLLFPTLAFGGFLPAIVVGQLVAKVLGSAIWYEVLRALPLRSGDRGAARHAHP